MQAMSLWTLLCCLASLFALSHGALVQQTLTLTWDTGAPNGQSREMIFVNGEFPGPNLVFDEDDDVEITVQNEMPQEATIHWHGLLQQGTPWSDGVPGVTQAAIQPGGRYVYNFKASPAGTYWYHSHVRQLLEDGLHGGIFIRPKPGTPAPWHLISNKSEDIAAMSRAAANPQLVVLSDWDRYTSDQYWNATEEARLMLFCQDSILINGKGAVHCPPQEFLVNQTSSGIQESIGNLTVTDKGCFPFVYAIDEGWLSLGRPEFIPPHLQSGCVASEGSRATILVDPADQWASINWIGAATQKTPEPSIDGHDMWVYEVDGSYIEPVKVQALTIWAGERYSAMVRLNNTPGVYTIRAPDYGGTQVLGAYADFVYKGCGARNQQYSGNNESVPWIQYGGLASSDATTILAPWNVFNDTLRPFSTEKPAPKADREFLFFMGRTNSSYNYAMNATAMYPVDWNNQKPFLYYPNSTEALDPSLAIRTANNTWVDLILQVSADPGDDQAFTHVIHKHGSKTWRIAQGYGVWNYSSVAEAMEAQPDAFNLETPGYRDTWLTAAFGTKSWSILRYQVTNPGPWFFHCHIGIHLAGGMGFVILDGTDAWPEIPAEYSIGRDGI